MKLTRSEPILFTRADGTIIHAQPCTRGRMREVLTLDCVPTDDMAERRGQIVAIYLADAKWLQADGIMPAGTLEELLASLDATEETDIIHAITVQHHGMRPQDAVTLQQAMREIIKKKPAPTQPTS
jgi:hypothetical protein